MTNRKLAYIVKDQKPLVLAANVENERICGIVSRGDFKGMEIDQLDEEDHLWECIR